MRADCVFVERRAVHSVRCRGAGVVHAQSAQRGKCCTGGCQGLMRSPCRWARQETGPGSRRPGGRVGLRATSGRCLRAVRFHAFQGGTDIGHAARDEQAFGLLLRRALDDAQTRRQGLICRKGGQFGLQGSSSCASLCSGSRADLLRRCWLRRRALLKDRMVACSDCTGDSGWMVRMAGSMAAAGRRMPCARRRKDREDSVGRANPM